jgi:CO/xanthine dehydrogenase FAD-binding subunit
LDVLQPPTWAEALQIKADRPEARPIAGGTDLMVELNFDHTRPAALLDLTRIPELQRWDELGGTLRVGAGLTYTRLIEELGDRLPGLAMAARTVGSPQIRNRGTVGGNLATSSPAGDTLPVLFSSEAHVELASTRGHRLVPVDELVIGPKRNCMATDELIAAYHVPLAQGPQQFAKIGTRNAMVIAVCSLGLSLWPSAGQVRACIGSAGPTPIRTRDAEAFLNGVLEEDGAWDSPRPLPDSALTRFGELVELAARPIDDVRGTAAYRHHALRILGRRTLRWAWEQYIAEKG